MSGQDVVVPQFLGRLDFVLDLEQLCAEVGARFVEVALLSDAQDVVERFLRRSAAPQSTGHQDAAALLERLGGLDALPELYALLLDVVAKRPATRTIATVDGEIDQAYRELVSQVEAVTNLRPRPDR